MLTKFVAYTFHPYLYFYFTYVQYQGVIYSLYFLVLVPWLYHYPYCFLFAFVEKIKTTISFVTSVSLFIRMKQVSFYWENFRNIAY